MSLKKVHQTSQTITPASPSNPPLPLSWQFLWALLNTQGSARLSSAHFAQSREMLNFLLHHFVPSSKKIPCSKPLQRSVLQYMSDSVYAGSYEQEFRVDFSRFGARPIAPALAEYTESLSPPLSAVQTVPLSSWIWTDFSLSSRYSSYITKNTGEICAQLDQIPFLHDRSLLTDSTRHIFVRSEDKLCPAAAVPGQNLRVVFPASAAVLGALPERPGQKQIASSVHLYCELRHVWLLGNSKICA